MPPRRRGRRPSRRQEASEGSVVTAGNGTDVEVDILDQAAAWRPERGDLGTDSEAARSKCAKLRRILGVTSREEANVGSEPAMPRTSERECPDAAVDEVVAKETLPPSMTSAQRRSAPDEDGPEGEAALPDSEADSDRCSEDGATPSDDESEADSDVDTAARKVAEWERRHYARQAPRHSTATECVWKSAASTSSGSLQPSSVELESLLLQENITLLSLQPPDAESCTPLLNADLGEAADLLAASSAIRRRYRQRTAALEQQLAPDPALSPARLLLFARALASMADVFYGCVTGVHEEQRLLDLCMACVASRVLRARAHQLRTSARLALQRTDGTANACDTAADDDDSECRDQGFTAARILVLAPTRHVAYCAVHSLIAVGGFAHVFHCRRFEEEYGPAPGDGTADEAPTLLIHQHTAAIPPPETVSDVRARNWFSKPPDFQTAFKGNIDDDFRIGLRLSRRTLRLYTDFFRSDIVLASPLGLQRLASDPERGGVSGGAVDSLSSIEMALVLRTDTMLMQNWEHLTSVLGNVVNRMPAKIPPGTDFGRVQQRFLDGQAARYRQTVWLAAWDTPEMHAMVSAAYRGHTHAPGGNVSGALKLLRRQWPGVVSRVTPRRAPSLLPAGWIRHVLEMVPPAFVASSAPRARAACEARFAYFAQVVLPRMHQRQPDRTLLFIPSYFDFVRVRHLLHRRHEERHGAQVERDFATCSEYTSTDDVTRHRLRFFEGRIRLLVISERFHFYRRYRIRGARQVLLYGPPVHPQFYRELSDMVASTGAGSPQVRCLYMLPEDTLAVHRLLGSAAWGELCHSQHGGIWEWFSRE